MSIKFDFVERIKKQKHFGAEGSCTRLPERATSAAAGYDFYYLDKEPTVIEPGKIAYVKTGVKASFPNWIALKLYNRSSNPKKKGLILANGVGVVDADYYNNPDNEGEIAFAFMNITNENVIIEHGDKLGQGIFEEYFLVDGDYFDNTQERIRVGGFGSTDNSTIKE